MLHETVVHRADAARTVGACYRLDPQVARDTVDEWMFCGTVPEAYDETTAEPLLGAGRTLSFVATDDPDGRWFVDLTGARPAWRHGDGPRPSPCVPHSRTWSCWYTDGPSNTSKPRATPPC